MIANDILKAKIRELKAAGAFSPPPTGLAIAGANRAQLDAWLASVGVDPMAVLLDHAAPPPVTNPPPPPVTNPPPPPPWEAPPTRDDDGENSFMPPPPAPTPRPAVNTGLGGLIDAAIQTAVDNAMASATPKGSTLTPDDIAAIVEQITKDATAAIVDQYGRNGGKPTRIEIVDRTKDDDETPRPVGIQHAAFPLMMAAIRAGVNLALVGPAGSGKTTAAANIAKALGKDFMPFSCGPDVLRGNLIGKPTVNGDFILGVLPIAMRDGAILLMDEFDKLNGALAPMVNSALANRMIGLETGETINASPEWSCILAMNTFGTGATDLYQSARQDAATLDRLFFLTIDYDWSMVAGAMGLNKPMKASDYAVDRGGLLTSAEAWLDYVHAVNRSISTHGIRHVLSPRAAFMGVDLAKEGIGIHWLIEGLIFKGLKPEQRERIEKDVARDFRAL